MADAHKASVAVVAFNEIARNNGLGLIPDGVSEILRGSDDEAADSAMATMIGAVSELFRSGTDLLAMIETLKDKRKWLDDGDAKYYLTELLPKLKRISVAVEKEYL